MFINAQRQLYITTRYNGDKFKLDDTDRAIITNGHDKCTKKLNVSRNK